MFIRSQNLFLRPAWAEDWRAILAGAGDEAVARNLAAVPWPYGEAEARWFASQPQDQRHPHFLITLPSGRGADCPSGALVGCIGLTQRPEGDGAAEFGYWIARAHWGRGYATEAGRCWRWRRCWVIASWRPDVFATIPPRRACCASWDFAPPARWPS